MKLKGRSYYEDTWVVGDNLWDLKFVRSPQSGCVGLCDPSTKTLYIKKNIDIDEIFRTFIHEVLHAIEDEYNINVKHPWIYKFEEGLADFFLNNLHQIAKILGDKDDD